MSSQDEGRVYSESLAHEHTRQDPKNSYILAQNGRITGFYDVDDTDDEKMQRYKLCEYMVQIKRSCGKKVLENDDLSVQIVVEW